MIKIDRFLAVKKIRALKKSATLKTVFLV